MIADTEATDERPLAVTVQLLAKHYEAVRDEALLRIRLKQGLLAFYFAFVGAVLGFSLTKDQSGEIAILIPLVSLGVAWMLWDHERMMIHFGHWMEEYSRYLGSYVVNEQAGQDRFPLWDTSSALKEYAETIKYL